MRKAAEQNLLIKCLRVQHLKGILKDYDKRTSEMVEILSKFLNVEEVSIYNYIKKYVPSDISYPYLDLDEKWIHNFMDKLHQEAKLKVTASKKKKKSKEVKISKQLSLLDEIEERKKQKK
jgi:hypothetical protein